VTLFFTGGGATTPAPADGSITVGNPPVPVKAVLLQIGPKFANAIELSAVPGFVAGLLKIKVKLPDGVTGDHVPVIVNTQGNLIANSPSLTISIR
jgi:uncharacterized protein (TIGR03437 family)